MNGEFDEFSVLIPVQYSNILVSIFMLSDHNSNDFKRDFSASKLQHNILI
jgi:hypothetical protein